MRTMNAMGKEWGFSSPPVSVYLSTHGSGQAPLLHPWLFTLAWPLSFLPFSAQLLGKSCLHLHFFSHSLSALWSQDSNVVTGLKLLSHGPHNGWWSATCGDQPFLCPHPSQSICCLWTPLAIHSFCRWLSRWLPLSLAPGPSGTPQALGWWVFVSHLSSAIMNLMLISSRCLVHLYIQPRFSSGLQFCINNCLLDMTNWVSWRHLKFNKSQTRLSSLPTNLHVFKYRPIWIHPLRIGGIGKCWTERL